MFVDQEQPGPYKESDIVWIPKLSEYKHTLQKDIKSEHTCLHVSLCIYLKKRIVLSDTVRF